MNQKAIMNKINKTFNSQQEAFDEGYADGWQDGYNDILPIEFPLPEPCSCDQCWYWNNYQVGYEDGYAQGSSDN